MFNPADHTVAEVLDYLGDTKFPTYELSSERARVLTLERHGLQRSEILSQYSIEEGGR